MNAQNQPEGNYLSLKWQNRDPFFIEASMVRRGGYIQHAGRRHGHGIAYHYIQLIKALWPFFEWHKWSKLLITSFAENSDTGVMGPASSGKTFCSAAFALATFYVWPQGTSIVISTTTREALQLRIWGAIKELNHKARERRPYLPGRIIESRYMLTGSDDDAENKDFRDGVIGVAARVGGQFVGISNYCFAAGTPVDTPSGPVPIEVVNIGDSVFSAIGVGKVTATFKHETREMLRVHLSTGGWIDCTPEHRFLTPLGWQRAVDMERNTQLLSPHETMQVMRQGASEASEEILQRGVQNGELEEAVRVVRNPIRSPGEEERFLFETLQRELDHVGPESCSEDSGVEGLGLGRKKGERIGDEEPGGAEPARQESVNSHAQSAQDHELHRRGANPRGVEGSETVPGSHLEPCRQDRLVIENAPDSLVPTGHSFLGHPVGCGDRRLQPCSNDPIYSRREAQSMAFRTWVDRVEVLEPAGASSDGPSGVRNTVYNLQVEGHPSYSVHGVVVHNCGLKNDRVILIADEASLMERGFLDSMSNLRKNPVFRSIALGNPKDRTDPLGMACEPKGGWDTHSQDEKTSSWKTRWGGIAIQLCGTDSPNYDYPRGLNPYRGLIRPEDIERDLEYYGRDSLQFSMMNLGIMPRDGGVRRVITRSLCESNMALEEAIWSDNSQLVDYLGLDAAYSGVGGDRCALTHIRIGPTVSMGVCVALVGKILVPVKAGVGEAQAEEQIAEFCRLYAMQHNIPPSRFGLDSTGRGTLVSALARIWSNSVHAVEFGGQPSAERMVRLGSTQTEAEAYGKMVTALWFASRLLIEAKQMRQLSLEYVEDGSFREWGVTKSGKIDIEPKEKTKIRMGRSPDLWDSLVVAIEVARRNGFQIAAGKSWTPQKRGIPGWMTKMRDQNRKLENDHALVQS